VSDKLQFVDVFHKVSASHKEVSGATNDKLKFIGQRSLAHDDHVQLFRSVDANAQG